MKEEKKFKKLNKNLNPSHKDFLYFLEGDNFEQKHYALAHISELKEHKDIEKIIKNLVDQDTKIRELASFRVYDFISENLELVKFLDTNIEIILRTANDVNPQVCRNIISILHLSNEKQTFCKGFIKKIEQCLEETKSIKFKSHKVNKKIFNLYWNLQALEKILEKELIKTPQLINILLQTSTYKDYTIRERAAFLAKKALYKGFDVDLIIDKLKQDSNFYVQMAVKN